MFSRIFARSIWESLLSPLVRWAFTSIRTGALIRALLTFFVGGLIWIALARRAYPHALSFDSLWEAIWLLFRIFLAADVFRRVLLAGFVIWAAYQLAAIYLDDIFELRDVAVAARFIRQAAFTASYDLMEIKDGWVNPDHRRSPVFL